MSLPSTSSRLSKAPDALLYISENYQASELLLKSPTSSKPDHTHGISPYLADDDSIDTLPNFVHNHEATQAEHTVLDLLLIRARLSKGIPNEGNADVDVLARPAVINIYDEALSLLGSGRAEAYQQMASEVSHKAKILLEILDADPDDPAFSTVGQLLQPLEPQYAVPRLLPKNDGHCRRAQWRSNSWRKEGWPAVYSREAIRHEAEKEKLVATKGEQEKEVRKLNKERDGLKMPMIRVKLPRWLPDKIMLETMMEWSEEDLGGDGAEVESDEAPAEQETMTEVSKPEKQVPQHIGRGGRPRARVDKKRDKYEYDETMNDDWSSD
jgi:hypothetical protein